MANQYSDSVTVIDGATNSATTVATGDEPWVVCVNPNTNKIYVANLSSDNVTVIDGATNSTTTVAANNPYDIYVNPNTNKIYVANYSSANVTVIDGATNSTTTVTTGDEPWVVSVNPNTNKIYVVNLGSDDVTVIDEVEEYSSPLTSSSDPLADNETEDRIPSFTGTADNSRTPTNCNIMKVLYQFETTQGEWQEAKITSGEGTSAVSWEGADPPDSLTIGFHSLYVVAIDSTSGTINMTENFTGSITPYYFLVKGEISGIETDEGTEELVLSIANPFINSTNISFILPAGKDAEEISLKIFDLSGRIVKTLVKTSYIPGLYTVSWDGKDNTGKNVAGGIYFCQLSAGNSKTTNKLIFIK